MPAALIAAASWLAVYGLDRLHATLRENPASLLEHLYAPGTHQGLSRCLRELPVADAIWWSCWPAWANSPSTTWPP